MNNWQSIETAPKDMVILTDQGTGIYLDQRDYMYAVSTGWYLCTLHGDIASCADYGMCVSKIEPTLWQHVPTIP